MPIVEVLGIALIACGVPVVLLQNYQFGLQIRAQAMAEPRDDIGAAGADGHHRAAPGPGAASGQARSGGSGLS